MISCPYLILCDSHRCWNVCPPHWLITADPLRRILKSTDSCPNWMASIWLWACHRKPTIIIIWPVYSICKVFNTVHCTIIQHHSVCRIFWVRLRSRIVNWNWQTHRRLTGLFIWSKFFAHYYILIIFFFIFSNSILQITSIFCLFACLSENYIFFLLVADRIPAAAAWIRQVHWAAQICQIHTQWVHCTTVPLCRAIADRRTICRWPDITQTCVTRVVGMDHRLMIHALQVSVRERFTLLYFYLTFTTS